MQLSQLGPPLHEREAAFRNFREQVLDTNRSQCAQDIFVAILNKFKKNGQFLEIGSSCPVYINNTFSLEKGLGWSGLMIEREQELYDAATDQNINTLEAYREQRQGSDYIIKDATKINFRDELDKRNFNKHIEYLQLDLYTQNRSTLSVLENLDENVFDEYLFATMTIEHDAYDGDSWNTREISREILRRRGYWLLFGDVCNMGNAFEDWYVHPKLVNMDFVTKIIRPDRISWQQAMEILTKLYTIYYYYGL